MPLRTIGAPFKTWLICGSRNINDDIAVYEILDSIAAQLGHPQCVIHGGATGADTIGGHWAAEHHIPITVFPAQWGKYGRFAGPKRNIEMLDTKPDLVVAFFMGTSKGTHHTVKHAIKRGIVVKRYEFTTTV